MKALRLNVADHIFELRIPAGPVANELLNAWSPFVSALPARTVVDVSFTHEPPSAWKEQEPAPRATRGDDGALLLEGSGYRSRLTPDGSHATIVCANARYPIDTTLKHLVADAFLRRGGLVVHGVCLGEGTRAALFSGPSGAGKSTLARCAAEGGLTILSDELVGIEASSGGLRAHGTLWNVSAPASATLAAIGILAWDSAPKLETVSPSDVLRVLASNVVGVDSSAATRNALFKSASEVLTRVPSHRLYFAQDSRVADVVRTLLGS